VATSSFDNLPASASAQPPETLLMGKRETLTEEERLQISQGCRSRRSDLADLPTQLESLLHTIWWCEHIWRLEDRIESEISKRRRPSQETRSGRGGSN